jgi:hypothetical protein
MILSKSVYDIAFQNTKTHVQSLIQKLVPSWAQSMVQVTDDEIRQVSNSAADAVVTAFLKDSAKKNSS